MIEAKDILSMNFYSYGEAFTGSDSGMRFRVKMEKRETGRDENDKPVYEKYFDVAVWPEPYSYESTEEDKITKKEFPFTEEGYRAVIEHLNANIASFAGSVRINNIFKSV